MKIGELAAAAGVTTKSIRYYESIGLLAEPERTPSGYRDYGSDAADRLAFIKQSQAAGLSLDDVRSVLNIKDEGRTSCEHTLGLLAGHLEDLDRRIDELLCARDELRRMYDRAAALDPADCDDPNRCQVIGTEGLTFPSTGRERLSS